MEYKISFLPCNPKDGEGNLQMRVRWGKEKLAVNLGYKVEIDKWDSDLQLCRNNTTHSRKKITAAEINKQIKHYLKTIEFVTLEYPKDYCPTDRELRDALRLALGRVEVDYSDNVDRAMLDYITKQSVLESWADNTIRKYSALRRLLKDWQPSLTFSQLDTRGLEDFFIHLAQQGKVNSTIKKYLTNLKSFLRWADVKGGYKVRPDYKTFAPRLKTIGKTIVWLTWDEMLRIYHADLAPLKETKRSDNQSLEQVRDMFCLACFTGMRYSDIVSLRKSDIYGDKIHLAIVKTAEQVTIELNPYSRELLRRNADHDVVSAMPSISNTKCNKIIKEICEYLGIDEPTTEVYYKGAERVQETHPKYELVTMHTGRRSFISNAILKGIAPQVIMKWTGHKDYKEMEPYIGISDKAKESAMLLFSEGIQ